MEEELTYLPFPMALREAKSRFVGDPVNPENGFAGDVLVLLRDVLNIPTNDADLITYYPADNSSLEIFHGVTGWVELAGGEDEPARVVTLEIVPLEGRSGQKADVIIEDLPRIWDQNYDDFLLKIVAQIVQKLAQRLPSPDAKYF